VTWKRYVALGDSISIDEYPLRETGIPNIGAASLLHRDLGPIEFDNLAQDGATTGDVLHDQLPHVKSSADPTLITITAGGNDMLMFLGAIFPPRDLLEGIIERITNILDELTQRLPLSTTLLGTVYDPSDGTSTLDGQRFDREAAWLARFNEAVRHIAESRGNVLLADIHRRFLGHGITVPANERWYWSGLIFEPNAKGAREVRNLWRELLRFSV
jgi:lysophospholipase L1-like esterase